VSYGYLEKMKIAVRFLMIKFARASERDKPSTRYLARILIEYFVLVRYFVKLREKRQK
jgi:hypothetical protein